VPHPNDPKLRSFIAVDPTSDFPIQNLPYGVFSARDGLAPRVGVAIGDHVLDLWELAQDCRIDVVEPAVFAAATLNPFMALGPKVWSTTRTRISELLREDYPELRDNPELRQRALVPMRDVKLHMPITVAGYTDFYSSKEHATNVGVMFRGKDNALQPNWLSMPIGYNGRASTVIVSGTKVRRPRGQLKPPTADAPSFGPCKRLDFELEMGVVIGQPSPMGEMLSEAPGRSDDLRLRDPQRLERARYPAMGICAARSIPGQGLRHLDQPLAGDARGVGTVPPPWPRAGPGAVALSAPERCEQFRS
jgi:fumarylacetoacetase